MPREYLIYIRRTGDNQLSQATAELIKGYCLGLMHGEHNFEGWHIGLTNDSTFVRGENFRHWSCVNYLEAKHTKNYFFNEKHMNDDSQIEDGTETIIYIYR